MTTMPNTTQRNCFVISPIGEEGSETRKRSDQVFRHVIEPCALECGYVAIRADQIGEPGIITNQVIQHLIDDPLVIADLSERNANVFYELAVRHVLRRPLVQIIRRGENIPFDVAPMRVVQFDHHDLDSVADAKREIAIQIRAIERDPTNVQSPISAAIDLETLKGSDRPEAQMLADLAASVADIRNTVSELALEQKRHTPRSRPSATFYGGHSATDYDAILTGSPRQFFFVQAKGLTDKLPGADELCLCESGKLYSECHGAERTKG